MTNELTKCGLLRVHLYLLLSKVYQHIAAISKVVYIVYVVSLQQSAGST